MLFIALLVMADMPATLWADLTINSGSSSSNVGTSLFVTRTGIATLDVTGGTVTGTNFYLSWGPGSLGVTTVTGGTSASSENLVGVRTLTGPGKSLAVHGSFSAG